MCSHPLPLVSWLRVSDVVWGEGAWMHGVRCLSCYTPFKACSWASCCSFEYGRENLCSTSICALLVRIIWLGRRRRGWDTSRADHLLPLLGLTLTLQRSVPAPTGPRSGGNCCE